MEVLACSNFDYSSFFKFCCQVRSDKSVLPRKSMFYSSSVTISFSSLSEDIRAVEKLASSNFDYSEFFKLLSYFYKIRFAKQIHVHSTGKTVFSSLN